MKKMFKKFMAGIVCLTLIGGMAVAGYAASPAVQPSGENQIAPYSVGSATIAFERKSSTQGYATIDADSTNLKTPYIKSTITLQESAIGASSYTNSNTTPKTKTVYTYTIFHTEFFPITTSKNYRIKVELTDVGSNGLETTCTYYVSLK